MRGCVRDLTQSEQKSLDRALLKSIKIIEPKPNDEVVKHLERLNSDAAKGELIGLAYVAIWRGNTAGSGYTSLDHVERIIGELAILQAKLVNECLKK